MLIDTCDSEGSSRSVKRSMVGLICSKTSRNRLDMGLLIEDAI